MFEAPAEGKGPRGPLAKLMPKASQAPIKVLMHLPCMQSKYASIPPLHLSQVEGLHSRGSTAQWLMVRPTRS